MEFTVRLKNFMLLMPVPAVAYVKKYALLRQYNFHLENQNGLMINAATAAHVSTAALQKLFNTAMPQKNEGVM